MFNVINNFIDNENFFKIQKIITNNNFPWFISDKDTLTFSHILIDKIDDKVSINSDFFGFITEDIIKKLQIQKINFCKLTLFARNKSNKEFSNNSDLQNVSLNKKAIFFLNTSNGYIETLESRLEAQENRILIYNIRTPFKLYTQTDTDYMVVLEIDYL